MKTWGKPREKQPFKTKAPTEEETRKATVAGYLIADEHVDASGALFEDLVDLPGGDAEELSDLLRELGGGEILQVDGVIDCGRTLAYSYSLLYIIVWYSMGTKPFACIRMCEA